jgi:hypothetical protein
MLELLDRQVGELERHGCEGDKPVRVGCAELGEPVVLNADNLCRDLALGAVPGRVDAQCLHVDALRIHLADASGADFIDARPTLTTRPRRAEQRLGLGNHTVRVDVDGLDATTIDHDFAPPSGSTGRA